MILFLLFFLNHLILDDWGNVISGLFRGSLKIIFTVILVVAVFFRLGFSGLHILFDLYLLILFIRVIKWAFRRD